MKTNEELIAEFMAKGGKVTKLPTISPEPKKPGKWNWHAWGQNKPGYGRTS